MFKTCGHKKFFSLSLLALLIFNDMSAKDNDSIVSPNIQIELRASSAFMICHHPEMKYFKTHFPIFEISAQQVTYGRKSWQSKSNYPAVGITLLYSDLGGYKEIGSAYAAYPFMSFNCLKTPKNQLNLKLGVGIGYITKVFEVKTNPRNTFIGAHFNAAINLTAEYNQFITNRLSVAAFVGFTHFSNGARRAPNNGINIAHAGLNTKYFISEPKTKIDKQPTDNQQYKPWIDKNYSFSVAFTYAIKDIDEFTGYNKTWSVYHLYFDFMKRLTEMSKLGVGFDLVCDMTDIDILKIKEIPFTPIQVLKPGINIAYEIAFGSTSFIFNVGCHVAGREMGDGYLYQKIGARLSVSKNIFLTCVLNTHFGWADYVGFGIGYKIN